MNKDNVKQDNKQNTKRVGNKNNRENNKQNDYRDENERRHETLNIIYQLRENKIDTSCQAVRTLIEKLNEYVIEGHDMTFSIPFPEINKKIKASLYVHKREECVVVLKHID